MKKEIITTLLLLTAVSANDYYLELDHLNLRYSENSTNKNFHPRAVMLKGGYELSEHFALEGRVAGGVKRSSRKNLIRDDGLGISEATTEMDYLYSVMLKTKLPLSENFSINPLLGVSRVKFSIDSNQEWSSAKSEISFSAGVGFVYDFTNDVYFSAEYVGYLDNVRAYGVGVGFRF